MSIILLKEMLYIKYYGRMAEWSKAVDLRPTIVRCEGSNPSSPI